jgi:threonine/homoserine/homoserine lactone efflux protein
MTYDVLLALCVFTFVSSVTPGPNNVMLLASGLNFGAKRTVPHLFGVNNGFLLMTLCIGLGLGQVFALAPALYTVMKVAGLIYMLWLAWNVANSGPIREGSAQGRPMTFMEAALFQWVNPKAWIMAISATASYSDPANFITSVIIIVVLFGLTGLPASAIWVFAGVGLRRFLNDPLRLRIVNIGMALLLVASLYPVVIDLLDLLGAAVASR